MVTEKEVLDALRQVMDPELGKDLVTLNMIRDVKIEGGEVSFKLILTTGACPLKRELEENARKAVMALPGVEKVNIEVGAESRGQQPPHGGLPPREPIPGVRYTIAVASGKGGVGKSTVTVNLALALHRMGYRVGILDCDIYGPSLQMMLNIKESLKATVDGRIVPNEKWGVKLVSIGFLIEEDTPVIWRGPMVMQLVRQFLKDVIWGDLDFLVIDLPPGTGDAQLTLVQTIPLTGAVVVTTPQDIALIDAYKAIKMFHEVKSSVIGIVENMSYFVCPHCGEKTEIFSKGGGEKASKKYGIPLIGTVPLDAEIREGGDRGEPIVVAKPDSPHARAFMEIAKRVVERVEAIKEEIPAST